MKLKPFPKYTYHLAGATDARGKRQPGRFVSKRYADANPDLTVRVKSKPSAANCARVGRDLRKSKRQAKRGRR